MICVKILICKAPREGISASLYNWKQLYEANLLSILLSCNSTQSLIWREHQKEWLKCRCSLKVRLIPCPSTSIWPWPYRSAILAIVKSQILWVAWHLKWQRSQKNFWATLLTAHASHMEKLTYKPLSTNPKFCTQKNKFLEMSGFFFIWVKENATVMTLD